MTHSYLASLLDETVAFVRRRTFPTTAAARAWRVDATHGVSRGTVRASEPTTVNEAADDLIAGMESGAIRTRSGDPSSVRSYREALDLHVRGRPRRDAPR